MTIRRKVIAAYTAVFGAMLVAFAYLVYQSSRDAGVARLDALLGNHAMKLVTEVGEQINEGIFPALSEFQSIHPDGLSEAHFRLLALDGSIVLPDSFLAPAPVNIPKTAASSLNTFQTFDLGGREYRILNAPVEVNDRVKYVLQLSSSLSGVESELARLRILFVVIIPLGLLIASLASFVITRAAFSPLTSMMTTAQSISAKNLDSRLTLPMVHDEIRLLAETLNAMIQRIDDAFKSQRKFLADASHEIRTPLTIICSELEYLQREAGGERIKEGLRTSLSEVERLIKMTDGMLILSKLDAALESPAMKPVRVDELLIDCVKSVQAVFQRKHQQLSLHISEAVEIAGDEEKLKRVLLNLLDNASKYTQENGKISARLWVEQNDPLPVCLAIEDSGRGIAAQDMPHIFKRFYRADSARPDGSGSGLGLAIAEQIVRLHGGVITVKSDEGKGSVFTVRLPVQCGTDGVADRRAIEADRS